MKKFIVERRHAEIHLKINREEVSLTTIEDMLDSKKIIYNHLKLNNTQEQNMYAVEIRLNKSVANNVVLDFVEALNGVSGIKEVHFNTAGI